MNFIALCQRARQEMGIAGTGPSTVLSPSGEMGRVVDWVNSAYQDIQNAHHDWQFLVTDFSLPVSSDDNEYSYSDASITNFGEWIPESFRIYLTATGTSDEGFLSFVDWRDYRDVYQFGTRRTQTGRPNAITIKPDRTLMLNPVPDDAFTVVGEYYAEPYTLSDSTDTPVFDSKYHMAIVWRALMMFGVYSAEPDKYAHGEREYKKILRKMEFNELPKIRFGAPLV